MSDGIPRLRMFAGPNGSGKTTVKYSLGKSPAWFGAYINPDEMEKAIRETGSLSLGAYGITADRDEVRAYFVASAFLRAQGMEGIAERIDVSGDEVRLPPAEVNSYHASVLADFLRRKMLDDRKSFTFETVMSSADKVELLEEARGRGFRTYLYFVATRGPDVNVGRVAKRVGEGGHDVPSDKIIARYRRCLDLLPRAIRHTDRAFLFDTSTDRTWYFAEVTGGNRVELKTDDGVPEWFLPVWGPDDAVS